MAALTVLNVAEAGLVPELVAAAAGGDNFVNGDDERTFLVVRNASAGPITVTVTAQSAAARVPGYGQMAKANLTVSVPATTGEKWIGPFAGQAFNDSAGLVQVTYSAVTSLTVTAVKVPTTSR